MFLNEKKIKDIFSVYIFFLAQPGLLDFKGKAKWDAWKLKEGKMPDFELQTFWKKPFFASYIKKEIWNIFLFTVIFFLEAFGWFLSTILLKTLSMQNWHF